MDWEQADGRVDVEVDRHRIRVYWQGRFRDGSDSRRYCRLTLTPGNASRRRLATALLADAEKALDQRLPNQGRVAVEAGGEEPMIETVLDCLSETRTRGTYSAVAAVIGGGPRNVSPLLAPRRPPASWVVNATTGMLAYTAAQMDLLADAPDAARQDR